MKEIPESIVKAAHRLNEATGGVASVMRGDMPDKTIHLMLNLGRHNDITLCGQELKDWEGVDVVGLAFANHPDHCVICEELLGQLATKAMGLG